MRRTGLTIIAATAVVATAGISTGVLVAAAHHDDRVAVTATPGYGYGPYRQLAGRYAGQLAGGAAGPFAGMMGGQDPSAVMGRAYADAPGPRVSSGAAAGLGNRAPAGARLDTAAGTLAFTGRTASFTVLASPSMPAESFRIAGLTNPTVSVARGAHVRIELINADTDMAHGLVVSTGGAAAAGTWQPMMATALAFPGAAVWFLGDATSAGMHTATLAFTASAAGTYHYLCPLPGHAAEGMIGSLVVR